LKRPHCLSATILERLATSSPDEYEDERASYTTNERKPFDGQFHIARKVAALWNEEDDVTRAKLLIAFGYGENYVRKTRQFVGELTDIKESSTFTGEQIREITEFIESYEREHLPDGDEIWEVQAHIEFTNLVRSTLGLPPYEVKEE